MALVDEIKLNIKAGRGGNGVVRWRHEKGKEYSGPSGGNGGKGGDVFSLAVRDMGMLAFYRTKKDWKAGNGFPGESSGKHGKNGEDLILKFPIGSIIVNNYTKRNIELLEEGQKVLLLSGGRGGLGNEHFKASTNTTPFEWTPGAEGEEGKFTVELQIIADAGLIGLPNAGKSSLLNALTRASAKVGAYPFTTLEPNLGDFYGYILADIPGLIEGASDGKGLGHKFLRHIKRTKILLHCISLEEEKPKETYETIRNELEKYDPSLSEKREIILLTKTDLVEKSVITKTKKLFGKKEILLVSVRDEKILKDFSDNMAKIFKELSKHRKN